MKHLEPDVGKNELNKIRSKYRNLPDNYYGGDSEKYLTPEKFPDMQTCRDKYVCQKHDPDNSYPASSVKMWEWYSGSAALSAYLAEVATTHLPPIDYRYGWNLSKHTHQQQLLDIQVTVGIDTLFAAPDCSPWGNNSRATPKELRDERRAEQKNPHFNFWLLHVFSRSS